MSFLGNFVWIICGGLISFLIYMLGGIVLCLTIVGIPFGIQALKIGSATLAPFGRTLTEAPDANSPMRLVLNVVWLLTFGWTLAINHLFWAGVLAVTVVGLPFALQHLKLIPLCLLPFGRDFR